MTELFIPLLLIALVLYFVARPIIAGYRKGASGTSGAMVCRDCGTRSEPVQTTPGSLLIELVLWLCFIVPGLIYSLWRLSARHDACAACGSRKLVPADSPVGRRIVQGGEDR